jgi:site-specific recombinase XerD
MKPLPLVSLQRLVQDFFEKHLTIERNASRNTVLAYRDSLRLYFEHAAQQAGCHAEQLAHAALLSDN